MTNRYTASFFQLDGTYKVQDFSSKAAAIRAAGIIAQSLKATKAFRPYVRVATPAGNLVKYVGDVR